MVQVDTLTQDSFGDVNHKLDFMVGNRSHGQLVQIARATEAIPVHDEDIYYDAFESITVSTTSVALTANLRNTHTHAFITAETAPVRWRPDGAITAPTATVGHLLDVGDVLELRVIDQLEQIRFIRRDGADGILMVSYGNRRIS